MNFLICVLICFLPYILPTLYTYIPDILPTLYRGRESLRSPDSLKISALAYITRITLIQL